MVLNKQLSPLSVREEELLILLTQGWTNHEIANRLVTSSKTVDNYTGKLYRKFEFADGVNQRVALVLWAIDRDRNMCPIV